MYIEFEKGQKYPSNFADISDDHTAFKDAGWILQDDDYVVDIDEIPKDLIKKIIVAFDIKTQTVWTDRGAHFYFKKPKDFRRGANRVSPLGFAYEIKHKGNTRAVTIKRNGILRDIEHVGVREEAPKIFTLNKQFKILYGMEDGEGRNNSLFALKGQLTGVREWRKILYFINENIFSEPLSDQEMDNITREKDSKGSDEEVFEYHMASELMIQMNFVQYGQRFYFKDGDNYTHEESLLQKEVFQRVGEAKTYTVDEIIRQMKYRCEKIPQETVFPIKFRNGFIKDGKFVEMIIDSFTPYFIDIDYDPEAEPVQVVDDYINHLTNSDEDYKKLLFEILGHTLIVDPEFKRMLAKFFIFIGDGGNGKGTLLQIIKTILGFKNVTGMSISELSDERYLPSFKGKLANLGDDLQDQAINDKDMKVLKNLSTCDLISTRELYKSAEDMYFTGSLIFTSNHILKSWEKGESYKRRVVWLPMYTKVKKKDSKFITNLTTEKALKYWIKLIIEGYKRLYANKGFTDSKIVEDFNKKYHEENNPALMYLDEKTIDNFKDIPVRDVYDDYESWCEDNAVNYNRNMIKSVIEEKFKLISGVQKINGKPTRCFMTNEKDE